MRSLCFFLIILHLNVLSAGWLDRKAEGWAWYEKRENPVPIEPNEKKSNRQIMDELRADLEEKLATALLDPTPEHIESYMREQKRIIDQSGRFAHLWSRYLLKHPDLDQRTKTPVSQYGSQIHKKALQKQKELLVSSLVKENGLFFFYKGKCEACQAFSRIVKAFSEKFGLEVLPVSLDGAILPEYPHSRLDNGIAKDFEVSVVPALFVVNPSESVITPIAYGMLSLDQLEHNVFLQFGEEEEADAPDL